QLVADGAGPDGGAAVGLEGYGVQGPTALCGWRSGAARAGAGLVVNAPCGFRGRTFGVDAQGVECIVGDEAAPDEVPEGFESFAGIAAAAGFVELGEEACALGLEVLEDGLFAVVGWRGL